MNAASSEYHLDMKIQVSPNEQSEEELLPDNLEIKEKKVIHLMDRINEFTNQRCARLITWSEDLGVSINTLRARFKGTLGLPGKDRSGKTYLYAYYPESVVKEKCDDLLQITPENVRLKIQNLYTPESWSKITIHHRAGSNFADTGIGFFAICTLLGVKGNITSSATLHALGRVLWPGVYENPEIKEQERVRTLILKSFVPETWASLLQDRRLGKNFAGTGIGLNAIARLFDVEGDPTHNNIIFHKLGRVIWPETYGDPEAKERARVSMLIFQTFTHEGWKGLTKQERSGGNFAGTGIGLNAIARLFDVEGDPVNNITAHHNIGQVFWPGIYLKPKLLRPDEIRALIVQNYTPDTWRQLPQSKRYGSNFANTNLGLISIATLLGIDGDPVSNNADLHNLGRAIWPDTYGDPEERERERIRSLILENFTADTWSRLRQQQRMGKNFAGTGLGLLAISKILGVNGNPVNKTEFLHVLGRVLWPETYGDPGKKEYERIYCILTTTFTVEQWSKLKNEERRGENFAATGMGFRAIATLLGAKGDPIGNNTDFHAMGRVLWPETYGDPEERERERIRSLILKNFTTEDWRKLTKRDCIGNNFAGTDLGITAIGNLFGIKGSPCHSKKIRDLIGSVIWGSNW